MLYKGKACEIVGEKEVFGQRIAWIRLMEDDSSHQVPIPLNHCYPSGSNGL